MFCAVNDLFFQEIECDTDDFQFKKQNADARQDTLDTMELLCTRLTEGKAFLKMGLL